jgi:hypothetical protein
MCIVSRAMHVDELCMASRYPRLAERATVSAGEGDGVDNATDEEFRFAYHFPMPARKKSSAAKVTGRIRHGKKSTPISELRFSDSGALTLSGLTGGVMEFGAVGSGKTSPETKKRIAKSAKTGFQK